MNKFETFQRRVLSLLQRPSLSGELRAFNVYLHLSDSRPYLFRSIATSEDDARQQWEARGFKVERVEA